MQYMYKIQQEKLQKVLNYLANKPFAEVAGLIQDLSNLEKIKEKKEVKKEVKK